MADKATIFKDGIINLQPQGSTPSGIQEGDLFVDNTTGLLKTNDGSSTDEIITVSADQELENKTFTAPVINEPIGLNKADVGLGNVDNTSDLNKPISTAQQTALNGKQPLNTRLTQISALSPADDTILQQDGGVMSTTTPANFKTDLALTKSDFGLSNVDNTSDAELNSDIATLTNKTLDTSVIDNFVELTEESSVTTPSAGKLRFYAKTDKTLNLKTSSGLDKVIQTEANNITVSFQPAVDFNFFPMNGYVQFPWSAPTLASNPDVLPGAAAQACAWSPNGEFMVTGGGTSPYLNIYQLKGSSLTKLSNPASIPTNNVMGCDFSSNSEFLACVQAGSPYVIVYQRSETTFTRLSNPATLPTGSGEACAWSPNGEFLAIAHATSPYITIYQRSGTTLTKLSNPATLPPGTAYTCSWSPNGEFLVVGTGTVTPITIYQRSNTTFTKISDPSTLPPGQVMGSSWSSDGKYLALAHLISPYMTVYSVSGTTFTKLNDPVTIPTGQGNFAAWSPNNKMLCIGHSTTPFISIYELNGSTLTKQTNPSVLLPGQGLGGAWHPTGQRLTIGHSVTPFVSNYVTVSEMSGNVLDPLNGLLKLTRIQKSF